MKLKLFIKDFMSSAFGVIVYNAVIQFIVYPYLQRSVGNSSFGDILSWISIISLLAATFGTGCNYSRMLAEADKSETDGNYVRIILYTCFLSIFIIGVLSFFQGKSFSFALLTGILVGITIIRYYADVKFRIDTDYKGFSLYYILIAAGYVFGIVIHMIWGMWQLLFLLGEVLAVSMCRITLKRKIHYKKNNNFNIHFRSSVIMIISQFMANGILQIDRISLNYILSGTEVTIYYVSTLCGKLLSLVSVPLNGVIIGYLVKDSKKVTLKMLRIFMGLMMLATLAFAGIGIIGSYILIPVLYPDVFDMAKPMFFTANLGQAFFFSSGICMTVILKYTGESLQLKINTFCLFILCILGITLSIQFGCIGMNVAMLITTISRFVLSNVFGMIYIKKGI